MFEQIGDLTLAEAFAGVVTLTALCGGVWVGLRRLRDAWRDGVLPFWRRIEAGLIILNGREAVTLPEDSTVELTPAIPGVLDRLRAIEGTCARLRTDVDCIKAEVTTNGGGSIKDAVKRIEERQVEQCDHLTAIDTRLDSGKVKIQRLEDAVGSPEDAA